MTWSLLVFWHIGRLPGWRCGVRENCVIDLEQWLSKILTVTHRERDILHHDYFPAGIYLWCMTVFTHAYLFIKWYLPLLSVIHSIFWVFLVVKYAKHLTILTIFKCTVLWHRVHSRCLATFTTIHPQNLSISFYLKKCWLPLHIDLKTP